MSIDTINDLPPRVQYVALAAQTVFPYPFPIFADADLDVYVDGVLKTLNTQYTVSGEGDDLGGNVTLATPLVGGEIVTIIRDIAIERDTDVSQNGPWSSVAYNDELDKVFLLLQQLKADFMRSLRISTIAEVDDADLELTVANFANMYLAFDADGKPTPAVLSATTMTQAILGQLLYQRTDAEIAAVVVPTNYYVPSHEASGHVDPRRMGGVDDAATNANTALANSLLVCAQALCPLYVGGGAGFLCTTNLAVPVGDGAAVDVIGSGKNSGGILFSGTSVTTGLTFTGTTFSYCGSVKNVQLRGSSTALRALTYVDVGQGVIDDCNILNFNGAGVAMTRVLMMTFRNSLIRGCGSATEPSMFVTGTGSTASTTFMWDHGYISGGNATQGGLWIDKTLGVTIIGGAIESSGILIRIGSQSDSTIGCKNIEIIGVDLENPGNGNPYIEMGAGISTVFIGPFEVRGCTGTPSSATPVPHAVRLLRCISGTFARNNWSLASGTSFHELEGTTNLDIQIESHRALFAVSGVPWVRVNDVQDTSAGPHVEWNSGDVRPGLVSPSSALADTATPSILIDSGMGGYYRTVAFLHTGATTVTALSGGKSGMEVFLRAGNGNTTLTHGTGAGQFDLARGSNFAMVSGHFYHFIHNGTCWKEVRTSS